MSALVYLPLMLLLLTAGLIWKSFAFIEGRGRFAVIRSRGVGYPTVHFRRCTVFKPLDSWVVVSLEPQNLEIGVETQDQEGALVTGVLEYALVIPPEEERILKVLKLVGPSRCGDKAALAEFFGALVEDAVEALVASQPWGRGVDLDREMRDWLLAEDAFGFRLEKVELKKVRVLEPPGGRFES